MKQIHLTQRIDICDTHFKRNLWHSFSLAVKNGWSTIMLIEKDHDPSMLNQHKPYQKLSFIKERSCCQFGGITKVLCIFSSFQTFWNRTINSNVCCQQLVKLEEAIKEKRPELANRKGIVFHYDNARPHTSFARRSKLLELGWEVTSHPPYSPDLAASDYHLLRSL